GFERPGDRLRRRSLTLWRRRAPAKSLKCQQALARRGLGAELFIKKAVAGLHEAPRDGAAWVRGCPCRCRRAARRREGVEIVSRSGPVTAGMPAPRREKRLVLRVLEIWRQARIDDLAPKAGAVKPADAGEDEPFVFMIELYDGAPPRFSYVGDALRPSGFPSSPDPLLDDCPKASVLHLVTRDWLEIV